MGGRFDLANKESRIRDLEKEINESNIWDNPNYANQVNSELINLKKDLSSYNKILNDLNQYKEILDISNDQDLVNEIERKISFINKDIKELEIATLLNRKYDNCNCYLEIHPGAGGTEACDWAGMLFRMYQMFCSKNKYSFEVIDLQNGDEAGIKSALVKISGYYPYGYFQSEQGVHRLVRISPFDSGARRHTSFAAVSVIPEIEKDNNIEIKPEEIRIDVYRSSGKGGQGVNTTDSAVRITHFPSGIVLTCQNERSQIQNKETAMKILISKLEQIKLREQDESINSMKGNTNIDFGNQIRNYTLEPYKLVKDVRTNYESSNVDKILDGDILPFMEEYLRIKR
ncbi:MAG: peptide chain release factor 2 [Bacilli bacterium]|nr:peptide chain release factor 2 [Bacilli bacterium]